MLPRLFVYLLAIPDRVDLTMTKSSVDRIGSILIHDPRVETIEQKNRSNSDRHREQHRKRSTGMTHQIAQRDQN